MTDALVTTLAIVLSAGMIALAVWRVWKPRMRENSDDEQKTLLCSECGYDLRGSPHRCPECGALVIDRHHYLHSLGNDWPADAIDPRPADINEGLVVLVSTFDTMEADLLRQQLEARGISAFVEGRRDPNINYADARRKVYLRVKVFEGDFDAATHYLARAQGIPIEMWNEWLEHRKEAASRVVTNGGL